jgi:hypothetical protein
MQVPRDREERNLIGLFVRERIEAFSVCVSPHLGLGIGGVRDLVDFCYDLPGIRMSRFLIFVTNEWMVRPLQAGSLFSFWEQKITIRGAVAPHRGDLRSGRRGSTVSGDESYPFLLRSCYRSFDFKWLRH